VKFLDVAGMNYTRWVLNSMLALLALALPALGQLPVYVPLPASSFASAPSATDATDDPILTIRKRVDEAVFVVDQQQPDSAAIFVARSVHCGTSRRGV